MITQKECKMSKASKQRKALKQRQQQPDGQHMNQALLKHYKLATGPEESSSDESTRDANGFETAQRAPRRTRRRARRITNTTKTHTRLQGNQYCLGGNSRENIETEIKYRKNKIKKIEAICDNKLKDQMREHAAMIQISDNENVTSAPVSPPTSEGELTDIEMDWPSNNNNSERVHWMDFLIFLWADRNTTTTAAARPGCATKIMHKNEKQKCQLCDFIGATNWHTSQPKSGNKTEHIHINNWQLLVHIYTRNITKTRKTIQTDDNAENRFTMARRADQTSEDFRNGYPRRNRGTRMPTTITLGPRRFTKTPEERPYTTHHEQTTNQKSKNEAPNKSTTKIQTHSKTDTESTEDNRTDRDKERKTVANTATAQEADRIKEKINNLRKTIDEIWKQKTESMNKPEENQKQTTTKKPTPQREATAPQTNERQTIITIETTTNRQITKTVTTPIKPAKQTAAITSQREQQTKRPIKKQNSNTRAEEAENKETITPKQSTTTEKSAQEKHQTQNTKINQETGERLNESNAAIKRATRKQPTLKEEQQQRVVQWQAQQQADTLATNTTGNQTYINTEEVWQQQAWHQWQTECQNKHRYELMLQQQHREHQYQENLRQYREYQAMINRQHPYYSMPQARVQQKTEITPLLSIQQQTIQQQAQRTEFTYGEPQMPRIQQRREPEYTQYREWQLTIIKQQEQIEKIQNKARQRAAAEQLRRNRETTNRRLTIMNNESLQNQNSSQLENQTLQVTSETRITERDVLRLSGPATRAEQQYINAAGHIKNHKGEIMDTAENRKNKEKQKLENAAGIQHNITHNNSRAREEAEQMNEQYGIDGVRTETTMELTNVLYIINQSPNFKFRNAAGNEFKQWETKLREEMKNTGIYSEKGMAILLKKAVSNETKARLLLETSTVHNNYSLAVAHLIDVYSTEQQATRIQEATAQIHNKTTSIKWDEKSSTIVEYMSIVTNTIKPLCHGMTWKQMEQQMAHAFYTGLPNEHREYLMQKQPNESMQEMATHLQEYRIERNKRKAEIETQTKEHPISEWKQSYTTPNKQQQNNHNDDERETAMTNDTRQRQEETIHTKINSKQSNKITNEPEPETSDWRRILCLPVKNTRETADTAQKHNKKNQHKEDIQHRETTNRSEWTIRNTIKEQPRNTNKEQQQTGATTRQHHEQQHTTAETQKQAINQIEHSPRKRATPRFIPRRNNINGTTTPETRKTLDEYQPPRTGSHRNISSDTQGQNHETYDRSTTADEHRRIWQNESVKMTENNHNNLTQIQRQTRAQDETEGQTPHQTTGWPTNNLKRKNDKPL